jgi:hypothetical protein
VGTLDGSRLGVAKSTATVAVDTVSQMRYPVVQLTSLDLSDSPRNTRIAFRRRRRVVSMLDT